MELLHRSNKLLLVNFLLLEKTVKPRLASNGSLHIAGYLNLPEKWSLIGHTEKQKVKITWRIYDEERMATGR